MQLGVRVGTGTLVGGSEVDGGAELDDGGAELDDGGAELDDGAELDGVAEVDEALVVGATDTSDPPWIICLVGSGRSGLPCR